MLVVLGGCGSDDGDDSATAGGGSATTAANDGVAEAKDFTAEFLKPPTSVGTDVALKAPPPKGKHVIVLTCDLPVCLAFGDQFKVATKPLGWTSKQINFKTSPESILQAVNQAIAEKPDGIVINGVPTATFKAALPAAEKAGIPMVLQASPEATSRESDPPFITYQALNSDYGRVGYILGNWIVADSNGDANVLLVEYADIPISHTIVTEAKRGIEEKCPDCKVKIIGIQTTDVGTSAPQKIVSELTQDPDINYVGLQDGSMALGVNAALREAGLADKVKQVGTGADTLTLGAVRKGEEYGYVQFSTKNVAFQGVDALARHYAGEELVPIEFPVQILTKETVADTSDNDALYELPRDLEAQFAKLWKVDGSGS